MSEPQFPEKKAPAQLKEGDSEVQTGGKQLTPPAFNLAASPIQRATPPDGGETVTPADTEKVADPTQVPGVVAEKTQAGGETQPDPNKKYSDFVAENPTTNVEIATWVLKAASDDIGFVSWNTTGAIKNWEQIRDGKATGSVADPSKAEVLKALPTVVALVKARVNRYIAAGFTGDKEVLQLGSFMIGRDGTHGKGQAIDINGISFTSKDAPDQVVTLMKDLPTDKKYAFGLPGQGEFFDLSKSLAAQKKVIEATGKAGTATGWKKFVTGNYKSTYTPGTPATEGKAATPGKWSDDESAGGGNALSLYMKSQKIKDQIGTMTDAWVYPDNDNHIHVDTRS